MQVIVMLPLSSWWCQVRRY